MRRIAIVLLAAGFMVGCAGISPTFDLDSKSRVVDVGVRLSLQDCDDGNGVGGWLLKQAARLPVVGNLARDLAPACPEE